MTEPFLQARLRAPLDRFDLFVDLALPATAIGLLGPSGAGKTTLLRCLAGLVRPVAGAIRVDGRTWFDGDRAMHRPPQDRQVGYVPQQGLLFPHQSVRQNLLAGARRARAAGRDVDAELRRAAELLEIDTLLHRRPGTLSAGERQRVALGRALCSAPRLLLLDEPFASLDIPLRRRVRPLLSRVQEEFALPSVLVSHDPEEVLALTRIIVLLRDGRVVRVAERDAFRDPEELVRVFLDDPEELADREPLGRVSGAELLDFAARGSHKP